MGNQPPPKKLRSSVGLDNPTLVNFAQMWQEPPSDCLSEAGSLFGTARSWFVRESYVSLFDLILKDALSVQIINGTAGIGKSSFLLYILARLRSTGKSVLLHFHRKATESGKAMFFPKGGGEPQQINTNHPDYDTTFDKWYAQISEDHSYFLVDGIVSFSNSDYPNIKYVAAKSPSCPLGWMETSQNRQDRWLEVWEEKELLSYATKVDIEGAVELIHENMVHLGGVSRYAFASGAAKRMADIAVQQAGAQELFKLVTTGLSAKFENQKVVDRLIHRHPPDGGVGVEGTSFSFASEYVSKKVAMALAIENEIETATLLTKFQGVGPAGGMRGVLFEAYAARKIADGGEFPVKPLGTGTEGSLPLPKTTILQKDTKQLFKTIYPPEDLAGRLVWPNPDYNLPAIDTFMLHNSTLMAHQMTVSKSHTLDIGEVKGFLNFFDSLCKDLYKTKPGQYHLYFVVPRDIYDQFSKSSQPITGPNGKVLQTKEAKEASARVSQWVMKVE